MIEFIGRIKPTAIDIERQMTAFTKTNKASNIQLDESTDVDKDAQCTACVR